MRTGSWQGKKTHYLLRRCRTDLCLKTTFLWTCSYTNDRFWLPTPTWVSKCMRFSHQCLAEQCRRTGRGKTKITIITCMWRLQCPVVEEIFDGFEQIFVVVGYYRSYTYISTLSSSLYLPLSCKFCQRAHHQQLQHSFLIQLSNQLTCCNFLVEPKGFCHPTNIVIAWWHHSLVFLFSVL